MGHNKTMDDKTRKIPPAQQTLDAKGLNCPMPILKAKMLLNKMHAGEILYVEATDPHAAIDFEAYCARARHELIGMDTGGDILRFYIRKAPPPS